MPEKRRFQIATATSAAEIAAIAQLFRAYATALPIDLAYQGFEAEVTSLPGKYAAPQGALLLARRENGEVIGCVALRPMSEAGCCELKRLFVSVAGRGQGLGRALANAALEAARQRGYREMRLDTLPTMTEALALYRQMGFADIPAYYDTPIAGTIFLRLAL